MSKPKGGHPTRSLRIAIATAGRFHVLDLARELADLGHDVTFYSMLPNSRVEDFGLDSRRHRSMLAYVVPLAGMQRYAPRLLPELRDRFLSVAIDRSVEAALEPCDVFIGMSGIFVRALRTARSRYGARIWVERGSRHILSQLEILAATPGARAPTSDTVEREIEGYRLADRIVIPSRHVAESFECDASAHSKLFVNPYGVKLDMFPCRGHAPWADEPLQLIYAGNWSLQKGCDILREAVAAIDGVRLTHVGALADAEFPARDSRFEHCNAVHQSELARFYADHHGFVSASRQDGLSMVLVQALACGLPIICSDRTGGEDLAHTPALGNRISLVPNGNVGALREAIEKLRDRLRGGGAFLPLSPEDLAKLSWSAYAKRYEAELLADCYAQTRKTPVDVNA